MKSIPALPHFDTIYRKGPHVFKHVPSSGDCLTNYVALLWVQVTSLLNTYRITTLCTLLVVINVSQEYTASIFEG